MELGPRTDASPAGHTAQTVVPYARASGPVTRSAAPGPVHGPAAPGPGHGAVA
ncbi:hypothetical protein G3I19_12155 [Streptomyces sp. SID10853]|uniref:hypothetical protein n=1 Tax=Streptomyces sp. SID10853 TaxID=2706028 RepID=UPI0013C2924D|nr:hypothetical protein [Streptomyces sp. SID10853]NDZ79255.1 hypothetical protein [Streptomyces sp. SID10853]